METQNQSTPTGNQEAAEVLRRIREAVETGITALDLSHLVSLGQLPRELAQLTLLEELDLSWCGQLQNLSLLTYLVSLQKLNLNGCGQISDLASLSHLSSLQELNLAGCEQFNDLAPLAHLNSLQELNLAGCGQLQDLTPLACLGSLQKLNLYGCGEISDFSPLANLTSLQTLDLSWCLQMQDLTPLSHLSCLQALDITKCVGIRQFSPLSSLLPTLQRLVLWDCQFDDLPREICGEQWGENVLDKVRAHCEDLKSGPRVDAEVKVLFLGNGGTGKSQLCRRLRGLDYDPDVPSTHGIQLSATTVALEGGESPVRLNLWDFGGQEIYHGSHALFLQGQAIFLLLWTPELERQTFYQECDLSFRHRPLTYWLDYLCAFAGVKSPVLLIQSQCDTPAQRAHLPQVNVDDFTAPQRVQVSAKTSLGLDAVRADLKEAVRDCLYQRPPPPIGAGRVRVRDRLRKMLTEDQSLSAAQRQHRLLKHAEFDRLCEEEGGISDTEALLDFLHQTGVIFYRPGLFGGRIVLDQNWALEAIYTLFDRKKILPLLRGYGRFSRADLEALIWWDHTAEKPKYTLAEQKVFLSMMESCGICFKVQHLSDGEWEYIAPELLPEWAGAQEQLLGRLRDDSPGAEASARYTFLHDGILRNYLSKLGEHAKDAAIYWKYGCWFYEQKTRSQALIETNWDDAESETGAGTIRVRAWGEGANDLVEILLQTLQTLPIGQAPEITGTISLRVHAASYSSASIEPRLIGSRQVDTIKLADLVFGKDPNQNERFLCQLYESRSGLGRMDRLEIGGSRLFERDSSLGFPSRCQLRIGDATGC